MIGRHYSTLCMDNDFGIISLKLTDPLSLLLDKITNNVAKANAVGFYYNNDVKIFNVYDNYPISWLHPVDVTRDGPLGPIGLRSLTRLGSGTTLQYLIKSNYVKKITCYCMGKKEQSTQTDSVAGWKSSKSTQASRVSPGPRAELASKSTPLDLGKSLTQQTSKPNIFTDTGYAQFSQFKSKKNAAQTVTYSKFNTAISNVITLNNKLVNKISKGNIFEHILTDPYSSPLSITGYSLVNAVLSILFDNNKQNYDSDDDLENKLYTANRKELSKLLLVTPKSINTTTSPDRKKDTDIHDLILDDLNILAASFVKIFLSNEHFRTAILNQASDDDIIFQTEYDLVNAIINSTRNGTVDTIAFNTIINRLSRQRSKILPTFEETKYIKISNDEQMLDHDSLKQLGQQLQQLVYSCNTNSNAIVDLGALISTYNNAVSGTNIEKVVLQSFGTQCTVSKSAVLTFPGDGQISVSIPIQDQSFMIPMYNPNLKPYTDNELCSMLLYLDSMRANNGKYDNRYTALQNEIVKELGSRSRSE